MPFSKLKNYANPDSVSWWLREENIYMADLFHLLYTDAHAKSSSFLPQNFPCPEGDVNHALFSRWTDGPSSLTHAEPTSSADSDYMDDDGCESQGDTAFYHCVDQERDKAARMSVDGVGFVNVANIALAAEEAAENEEDTPVIQIATERVRKRRKSADDSRPRLYDDELMTRGQREDLDNLVSKHFGLRRKTSENI